MKVTELDSWARSHFDYFLDAVRIYLGIGLLFKGISFLTYPGALSAMNVTSLGGLASIVPYVHMVGGSLLAIGLLPRLAALANIPILFVAAFSVHMAQLNTLR